jgi:tetratricopeptide (TPR) repeat protein
VVLLLLGIGGILLYARDKLLFFWYALFFAGLIPVSQIVPLVTLINDRYLYFPMLGAAAFCVSGAFRLGGMLGNSGQKMAKMFGGLLLVLLLVVTWQRIPVWKNSITLWSDAVTKVPSSKIAWFGLGNALDNNAEPAPAIRAYENALAIDPAYREGLDNISILLLAEGDYRQANLYLARTVAIYPKHFDAIMNLGTSFYLLGDYHAAETYYLRALQLKPASPEELLVLANLQLRLKRNDAARNYYRQALAASKISNTMQYGMAGFQALSGNRPEALKLLEDAINNGFSDCRQLDRDPDLDAIRDSVEFRHLLELCKQTKGKRLN